MEKTRAAFREAVAETVWAWASIDSYLILVLSAATKMTHPMTSTIYFAVSSTESRFRIIDAAISELVLEVPAAIRIRNVWSSWLDKANRLKNTRNKIVHGHVTTMSSGRSTDLRLTPPFWSYQNIRAAQGGATDTRNAFNGLSLNDVEAHHRKMNETAKILIGLPDLMNIAYTSPESLPEKFVELEERLKTMGLQLGDQSPPKPLNRPQSSAE